MGTKHVPGLNPGPPAPCPGLSSLGEWNGIRHTDDEPASRTSTLRRNERNQTDALMAPSRASNALLHIVCRGTVRVAFPPVPAVRFFTPEGERACPPGWDPAYPALPEDDTALSTVVTHANGYDTV
jgi:hypothetical protein